MEYEVLAQYIGLKVGLENRNQHMFLSHGISSEVISKVTPCGVSNAGTDQDTWSRSTFYCLYK